MRIKKSTIFIIAIVIIIGFSIILLSQGTKPFKIGEVETYYTNDKYIARSSLQTVLQKFIDGQKTISSSIPGIVGGYIAVDAQQFVELEGLSANETIIAEGVSEYKQEDKGKYLLVSKLRGGHSILYQGKNGSSLGEVDCVIPVIPNTLLTLLGLTSEQVGSSLVSTSSTSCVMSIFQQEKSMSILRDGYSPLCSLTISNKVISQYACELSVFRKEREQPLQLVSLSEKFRTVQTQKEPLFGFVPEYEIGCANETCSRVESIDFSKVMTKPTLDKIDTVYTAIDFENRKLLVPSYSIKIKGGLEDNLGSGVFTIPAKYTFILYAVSGSHFYK